MLALLSALVLLVAATPGDEGRQLYLEGCAQCHGLSREGVEGSGPDLRQVDAAAVDFYLSTGRMPLDDPGSQPERHDPQYSARDIDALVQYLGTRGTVPQPDPQSGDLARGFRLYTDWCAGCHQIVARGGSITGASVPTLLDATPTQIAEAVRIGPYVMPSFDESQIDDEELNDIIRYVQSARDPDDRGGWSIGNIGPIPEGMVAWLVAGTALILLARTIGKRL